MDLFVINRYWGENSKGQDETIEPKLKMKKLLQRIEERKNLKEQQRIQSEFKEESNIDVERDNCEESVKSPAKKVKKRKHSENVIVSDICNESDFKVRSRRDTDDENGFGSLPSPEKLSRTNERCDREEQHSMDISEPQTEYLGDDCKSDGIQESSNEEKSNKVSRNAMSSIEHFTVIGTESFKGRVKASHKLPPWLENPVTIPVDLESFKDPLSNYEGMLDQKLIKTLRNNGITHFFPVQAKVIPWLLESNLRCRYHWPRDLCVSAPTGSGKTLAFVLPIVQALMDRIVPEIRVLVVLPVVELAKQVGSVFRQYCSGTGLQVTVAVGGGKSFATEHSLLVNQGELLGCQTDIFVTTPGRLVAHLRADSKSSPEKSLVSSASGEISLKQLQFLVIDEADRVAEGGQNDWLSHLVHHLEINGRLVTGSLPPSVSTFRDSLLHPCKPPQKLLFSATLSHDPEKLSALSLFQPKLFLSVLTDPVEEEGKAVTKDKQLNYMTPKELSEEYVVVNNGESEKPLVLLWILQQRLELYSDTPRVLIFAGTRKSSMRLALLLSLMTWDVNLSTITSCHLSSDLSVQNREKVLQDFVKGRTNILVCSDALARGVDVPLVDLVISYDPPRFAKNHIHRIGRTGRAGHPGCAITILTPNQLTPFACMVSGGPTMGDRKKIEINESSLSGLNEKYEVALASMEKILQDEHQNFVVAKKKGKRKVGRKKVQPNDEPKRK